jgi:hypothetical protein
MKILYYKQWFYHRLRNWLIYPLYSRVYQDRNRDISRCILLAGTARSGTTWMADLISSQIRARVMFEPFHSQKIPEISNINYFQYLRPETRNDELLAYCRKVFSGAIRDKWIDRQISSLFPKYRIIKEIRANLFLRWIHNNFLNIPILFLIRHPCAVVLSRMQLNWATDGDIEYFLSQDTLVEDFLVDKFDLIANANSPEEKHALIWCISNLVPLTHFSPGELNIIHYENLCLQPEIEIPRIFQIIGLDYDEMIFSSLDNPSRTVTRDSAVMHGLDRITQWKSKLSPQQIHNILSVVESFELDYLYGDSYLATVN